MVNSKEPVPREEEFTEVTMLSQAFHGETFDGESTFISGSNDGTDEAKTFSDMTRYKNWKEWWKAMCTESKKVWKIRNKWKKKPPSHQLIGN
jgi:hypothetical protein